MNIEDAKPGQYCLVRMRVQGVIGGGLVVKVPAGPRVIIKPEYLDDVTLVEEAAEVPVVAEEAAEVSTKKKEVKKADD